LVSAPANLQVLRERVTSRSTLLTRVDSHARHLRAASNNEVRLTKWDERKTQALLLESLAALLEKTL
jgi:hypothetical protein